MFNQNVETTKKGYAAFTAGDFERTLTIFDEAVEWTLPGASTISGTYRGKGELTDLFEKLAERTTAVEIKSIVPHGDVVVALTEVTVEGVIYSGADVYTYRDGKIVKAQSFGDSAAQERIFGRKQVAARV